MNLFAAAFLIIYLQFPPSCGCLQAPAGTPLAPFEHLAVELIASTTNANEGVYTVRRVALWPLTGIVIVYLDPPPPYWSLAFQPWGVVPVGPRRLIFEDGTESGDLGKWAKVVGGS